MTMNAIPRGIYRHVKRNEYLVLGTAIHSETQEEMVVYLALYGEYRMSVRPAAMFVETVHKPEYNYQGPRFKLIRKL